ncbi:DUF6134 family protein [Spirosoma montaniterrae]|uniref:DUF6134 family protein n=1 Tax=Spirosoma montaniterrae TaxID=1178516 RepID=UPI0012F90740|nr:DUF6134 family protein [Spirosoma montaniterrae]
MLTICPSVTYAQKETAETRRYAIEVAGAQVGTLTATRKIQPDGQWFYTLISDVKVNFLIYKLKIYYKVDNLVRQGQLMRSTVETHTNRGDYVSRTEWKGDHYDIVAQQYKHDLTTTERALIDYTITDLYFTEPTHHKRAYAEYFGDFSAISRTPKGSYLAARRDGRADEYTYENGQLVKVIKKNPLKNFVIRLLPAGK